MATGSDLIDMVGHLAIGKIPTTTTRPTIAQIIIWLNQGQNELAKILPENLIYPLVITYTPSTAAAAVKTALPTSPNVLRPIAAYDNTNNKPLKFITHAQRAEILAGYDTYFSTSSYVYTLGNDGTNDVYYYYPSTNPINKTFIHVVEPTDIADNTTEWDLPDVLEGLVVDYGVIKHKMQDEETEQQLALLKSWYDKVSIFAQGK